MISTYWSLVVHAPPLTLRIVTTVLAAFISRSLPVLVPSALLIVSPNWKDVNAEVRVKSCSFELPAAGLTIVFLILSPIIETYAGI